VAAGALAFEGVESLMHGFGHSAGFGEGSGFGGGFGGGAPEETVVNNYYEEPGRGDASNLQATGDDFQDDRDSQDDVNLDDTSYDDSSFDDSQSGNDDLV
jgi:hypothetical protein